MSEKASTAKPNGYQKGQDAEAKPEGLSTMPLQSQEPHIVNRTGSGDRRSYLATASSYLAMPLVIIIIALVSSTDMAKTFVSGHLAEQCIPHSGSVECELRGDHWGVYARNADNATQCVSVESQMEVIHGAMTEYLSHVNRSMCGVSCIKEFHHSAGAWAGFVSLTPAGTPVDGYYCGAAHSFGDCIDSENDTMSGSKVE